jgi:phage recombination protein Bet
MSAPAEKTANALVSSEQRRALITTLQNSLYPCAKTESVEMVLAYCEAAHLDVMQKPVHIVGMSVLNPQTNNYEWRDVIMPGIGLYRIQADRSGSMAGMNEPEFGPEISRQFTDKNGQPISVTFPEWCRVVVKKLVHGHIVDFVAKEFWLENYTTDSGKSNAPNKMWRKRPKGQLAKCAEAQALRKGWPDIGQAPTAEEMEGKIIEMGTIERVYDNEPKQNREPEPLEPVVLPIYPDEGFKSNLPAWKSLIKEGKKTAEQIIITLESRFTLTDEQKLQIKNINTGENQS